MKILMDTHILIWFLEDSKRLRSQYIDLLVNPINIIYFSSISIAEMAIKASKNKLRYPDDMVDLCIKQDFQELSFTSKHSILLKDLPLIHNDPFDRMLIVQAQGENILMMSEDKIFFQYDVQLIK